MPEIRRHEPVSPAEPIRALVVSTTYPRFENDHRPRFVADLCEHLVSDHNIQVTVVAPHAPGLRRREQLNGVTVERFQYCRDPQQQCIAYGPGVVDNLEESSAARRQLPFFIASMVRSVAHHLRDHDLIHAHWIQPALIAMLANIWRRRPLVLTVHRLATKGRLQRFALEKADHVLFNSQFTLRQATSQGCRFRGDVAYQGFDSAIFGRTERSGEIRRRLDLPKNALIVAAVARMVEFKGFHILLEAADSILASNQHSHLVLVGSGPEKQALERRAASCRYSRRIHFPGPFEQADVAQLLAESDVFVNPGIVSSDGRVETLGVATIEAAASSLPAIGSGVGGIPETIEDGVTGLLVESGNSKALALAVTSILDDPRRRAAMGREARKLAHRHFTWKALASRVVNVYEDLVETTPQGLREQL